MTRQQLTFDQLIQGLSRKKSHDSSLDALVSQHSDKAAEITEALIDADANRLEAIAKILCLLPKQETQHIQKMLSSSDITRSQKALKCLTLMGERGVEVALNIIEDPRPLESDKGARLLRKLGSEAVPVLREKLNVENPSKRGLALLMELDPEAVNFFEDALENMLSTQDQILSGYAIHAAASIGDFALPILIDMIGSPDPFEQQNATNALIKIGEPIVIELVDELDNPNSITQQNAIRALKEIGLPAVPALKEALTSDSQLIKQNASAVLSSPAFKKSARIFSRFRR